MKKRFTKTLPLFLFTLFFAHSIFAADFISVTNGNWNDASTWNQQSNETNQIPGLFDNVIIDGHKITINSDVGEVANVTVKSNFVTGDSKLIMIQGGRLTTTFNLVVEALNRAIDTEVLLSGDAILNVVGQTSFKRANDNEQENILRLSMIDSTQMFVGGTFTFVYGKSADGEQTEEISLNNDAELTISGYATFDVKSGKNFETVVNGNAKLQFNEELTGMIDDARSLTITANNGGTILFKKNLNILNQDSPVGIILAVDNAGLIQVDDNVYMTSNKADRKISLSTDNSEESVISVGKNISIIAQSEGDALIKLEQGKLEIGGNFDRSTNYGSITMGETASLVYNGTTPQVIACNTMPGAGSDEFDIKNMMFDNPSGMLTEGPLMIDTELKLQNGVLETTESAPIVIADGATISGGSKDAFISGPVRKLGSTGSEPFVFPLGKGGTYAPIEITPVSQTNSVITADYKGDPPPYINRVDESGLAHISSTEHWTLSRTGGTEDIQVSLHWTDAGARGIDDLSSLVVAQLNPADSTWYSSGVGIIEGDLTSPGSVETGDPPPYIEAFTFASTLPSTNSLPVEMIKFDVRKDNDHNVHLFWETASELNSDYFMVERSENGIDFYSLNKVKSNGTTSQVSRYNSIDKNPFYGMNYYRLRQVDLDGKEAFSEVLVAKFGIKSAVLLFPNPVLDDINIRLENEFEKEVLIEIFDQSGRLIFSEIFEDVSKYMKLRTVEVNITNRGTYFMKIHTSSETIMQKFMAGY